jgi:murein DD-endopeptidase MepM/ murein hydrolase activator NlpD
MRSVVAFSGQRPLSRLAVMGVLAVSFVGCSADTSRFNSPDANPFAWRSPGPAAPAEVTGSVRAAPTSAISSQPLAPPPNMSRPTTVASTGISGGGQGFGSYTPPSAPAAAPVAAPLPPSRDITGSITRPPASAPAPHVASAPAAPPAGKVHIVAPGETLMSISRSYHKPLKQIADANHIPPHTHLKIGDRITIPGGLVAAAAPVAPAPAARPAPQPAAPAVAAAKVQPPRTPAAAPAAAAPKVTAEAAPAVNYASAGAPATAEAGAGGPAFRWPLRGRVISGFPKNDGIDLAVPEGTAVHAAEDGVVAYAGSELKGYGNLILIRHANGYVTAYAHASELMVKRNDSVRRGQVIAKSGQTGSVSSPQLHFEIRKGSTPVDPMQFLPTS